MPALREDLEAYATLAAELADPGADRGALLAAHGLDEEAWEAIDDAWQARLSEDDDGDDDEAGGVPPLLAAWSEAFARAQRSLARSRGELSFERFVEAARAMKRGIDMATVFRRLEMTLSEFLEAERRFTQAMLADEELAERFRRAMQ